MDNTIRKLLERKEKVTSVVSKKGFIDIGDKATYEKAKEEYKNR